jgi:hypothetical protein
MRTLVLELADEQAQALEREAQRRGQSISEVAGELLSSLTMAGGGYDVTQDPIYNIKAHETEAPSDLSQNADRYLYGAKAQ